MCERERTKDAHNIEKNHHNMQVTSIGGKMERIWGEELCNKHGDIRSEVSRVAISFFHDSARLPYIITLTACALRRLQLDRGGEAKMPVFDLIVRRAKSW